MLAVVGLVALVPEFAWSSGVVRGLALGILSAFTFALLAVRNRALVEQLAPSRIALWQNAFAALCLAPIVAFSGPSLSVTMTDVGLLLVLGVACTGVAHTLFIASLQRVSAHTAAVVAALEPVYGIALAAGAAERDSVGAHTCWRRTDRRRGHHGLAPDRVIRSCGMNTGFDAAIARA